MCSRRNRYGSQSDTWKDGVPLQRLRALHYTRKALLIAERAGTPHAAMHEASDAWRPAMHERTPENVVRWPRMAFRAPEAFVVVHIRKIWGRNINATLRF